jgi:curved DNA-binding protein CbpA
MQEINEAYEILGDPRMRVRFDELLARKGTHPKPDTDSADSSTHRTPSGRTHSATGQTGRESSEFIRCPKCKRENPDHLWQCVYCGSGLQMAREQPGRERERARQQQTQTTSQDRRQEDPQEASFQRQHAGDLFRFINCPKCGHENSTRTHFCIQCGFTLPKQGPKKEPQREEQRTRSAQQQKRDNRSGATAQQREKPGTQDKSTTQRASAFVTCPKCNEENSVRDLYCHKCGRRLQT